MTDALNSLRRRAPSEAGRAVHTPSRSTSGWRERTRASASTPLRCWVPPGRSSPARASRTGSATSTSTPPRASTRRANWAMSTTTRWVALTPRPVHSRSTVAWGPRR